MIHPTNGRVVLFRKGANDPITRHDPAQALTAMIVHVWDDRRVNLVVFDSNGHSHPRESVRLLQDDDAPPEGRSYAEWMPYQKGQAAKTEQLEQKLAGGA
jgi:hypothetical protein